jgi:hypothetical protein
LRHTKRKKLSAVVMAVLMLGLSCIPAEVLPLPQKVKEAIEYSNPFTIRASAEATDGNGHSWIDDGSGDGDIETGSGGLLPTDPRVTWDDGDGWEFQIWINGRWAGSVFIDGGAMGSTAGLAWAPSNGQKHSTTATGGNLALKRTKQGFFRWSAANGMVGEGIGTDLLSEVVRPLAAAGARVGGNYITVDEYNQLQAQATMTDEQKAEAVENGTWLNVCVSGEPYGLVRDREGGNFGLWKRQAYYQRFQTTQWQFIARRLSSVWVTQDVIEQVQLSTGGNPTWEQLPRWAQLADVPRDNYVVWWNEPGETEPPDPPDTPWIPPDTPEAGLEELHIQQWELLGAIPTDWDEGEPQNRYGGGTGGNWRGVVSRDLCILQKAKNRADIIQGGEAHSGEPPCLHDI